MDLLDQYKDLKAKADQSNEARIRAEARVESAQAELAQVAQTIKAQGFENVSALQAEIDRLHGSIEKKLALAARTLQ